MRANDRLIDSVAKVTELLRANQTLREEVDHQARQIDGKDYELYNIQQENIRLREQIDVLESSAFSYQNRR
jgi:cell shape-determining protein MreC